MKRHLVAIVGLVDSLHDIHLAVVGPVARIRQPKRRPGTATIGAVLDIEEEETLVVSVLRGNTDRKATSGCVGLVTRANRGINAEDSSVVCCVSEVL